MIATPFLVALLASIGRSAHAASVENAGTCEASQTSSSCNHAESEVASDSAEDGREAEAQIMNTMLLQRKKVGNTVNTSLSVLAPTAPSANFESASYRYHITPNLFKAGSQGHHSYRIPSIVSAGGRLLAFCEGRVKDHHDSGTIHPVYRVSDDNGYTWSKTKLVVGAHAHSPDTWGNPTAVYEEPWSGHQNGRVHLFMNWNSKDYEQFSGPSTKRGDRQTWYTHSDDLGETWEDPKDLTAALLPNKVTFDFVGPGVGIQLTTGPNKGMLVVPAYGRNIVSSDHGKTWRNTKASADKKAQTSETAIAECSDGTIYRNDKALSNNWKKHKRRWVVRISSPDNPGTSEFYGDDKLLDPRCEGSLLRYDDSSIIFINSASTDTRTRLRVRMSKDCGFTWLADRWLYDPLPPKSAGIGGYTSMARADDGRIAVLVETNDLKTQKRSIDLVMFSMDWLGPSGLGAPPGMHQCYSLQAPWTQGEASNCKNLGCETMSSGDASGLADCQATCDAQNDCDVVNFLPDGADGKGPVGRCCRRKCSGSNLKLVSQWKGWDVYRKGKVSGCFKFVASWQNGVASYCRNLGCSTMIDGYAGGLQACQMSCQNKKDCNLINFKPVKAGGTAGRCCLRMCSSHSDLMLSTEAGGWDVYIAE